MTNVSLAQLEAEALAAVNKLIVPPCPHVLSEIGRELRREAPDVRRIAEQITHDATSSAVILMTVNSAIYGLSSKARSVQQAIANLGLDHTSYLLAGLLLRNAFPSSDKGALMRFWDTSMELALCAAYVASELGTVDRDEAYTYALFRDIGRALLICKFDDYDEASAQASPEATSNVAIAEKRRFGTDHTVIGAGLARDLQLPDEMIEAILWHHADNIFDRDERPISDESLRLIAVGALCDRIVDDYEGAIANDATIQLTAKALRVLDLPVSRFEDLQVEATERLDQLDINAMPTIRVHAFNKQQEPR
jgi:putative nucleotidyltransferase with HDIG domain